MLHPIQVPVFATRYRDCRVVLGTPERDRRRCGSSTGSSTWACPHGHLHRALAGPKSIATEEVQRKRLERPCPRHQARKVNHLLADVIREHLSAAEIGKRSFRNDKRYGETWTKRLGGRSLEEVTPA